MDWDGAGRWAASATRRPSDAAGRGFLQEKEERKEKVKCRFVVGPYHLDGTNARPNPARHEGVMTLGLVEA